MAGSRRYSTSSSDGDGDSRFSRSSAGNGRTTLPAIGGAPSAGRYADDSTSSDSDGALSAAAEEEAAYAEARSQRRARQAARRSRGDEVKPVRVMHSLGLNKTPMRKLLPPQDSDDEALLAQRNAANVDPEAQAAAVRSSRKSAAAKTSPRRWLYIGVVVLLLVVLIVVGVVLGVVYVKRREAYEATAVHGDQALADKAALDAQGQAMQSALGMTAADGHGSAATGAVHGAASTGAAHGAAAGTLATATAPLDVSLPSPTGVLQRFPELQALFVGNREWRNETVTEDPKLLPELAEAQHPKFAYIGCADSRVPETTILDAKPGELFVTRNVGNQYLVDDLSSETVISYAVAHLGVQHIVVMGHTECGAVKAAIASPSDEVLTNMDETRIDTWIRPIRSLYATSNRTEVVKFREAHKDGQVAGDDVSDGVWRALVEENVKLNVQRVAAESAVQKMWHEWRSSNNTSSTGTSAAGSAVASTPQGHRLAKRAPDSPVELWVHGWVYDVSTGLIADLSVSVGPS